MAADTGGVAVAAAARPAPVRAAVLARVAALPARLVLAGIVSVSLAVRSVLAFAHATPVFFPDEYIYSSLARSLASSGRPLVREGPAHFPALLEPLLAAPFSLLGNPELAYRLTQMENALAMSLAAIPIYLLARRLELGAGFALGAAALAVATQDLYYVSFVLADPIAYPLVLAAVCAGVSVLARPTPRAQLAFVLFAGLAAFARIQYLVVPLAFLVAALVVERGRVAGAIRSVRLTLVLLGAPAAVFLAFGPARLLGYYSTVSDQKLRPGALLHWVAVDGMLLAYAAGFVLVPGALVGLAYALARPRSRAESAFAALTLALAVGLLAEAAVYASNGSSRFQERYLFTLLPLLAPAFGIAASRGWPRRRIVAALALGLLLLSATVPLAGYTQGSGKQDSPFLFAVFRLEKVLGAGGGSLAVALLAAILSLVAAGIALRGRGATLAVGLSLAFAAAASAAAFSVESRNSRDLRAAFLPADLRWVDHSGLHGVALLKTPGSPPDRALEQLFWNTSVTRLLLLDGAEPTDVFAATRVRVSRNGRLLADGRPLRTPLLVENFAVRASFRGATLLARGGSFELWRPDGTPRLALLAVGYYQEGWLAGAGQVSVWPDASGGMRGTLRLVVGLPQDSRPTPLHFTAPGIDRRVTIAPGEHRTLSFQASAHGPWTLRFRTDKPGFLWDGRAVSVQAAAPAFTRAGDDLAPGRPSS